VKNTLSRRGLRNQNAASCQALAERLQNDHVLPVRHDDARKGNTFFVLHGVTDDDEGFRPCLAIECDVVGLIEIALVDINPRDESVNIDRVGTLDLDRL
jgi:hypothetical protein